MCFAAACAAPARAQYPDRPIRLIAAVPGRRRGRSRRAARHRAHGGRSRKPVRDREPRRRRRRHRDRRDRQGRARRLHAAAHHAEPHHQRGAAGQAALRHREGPRAGRDRGRGAGTAGQPSGRAVHDFAGFVDYAKANPGKLNYSSAGNGTLPHVTMELLLRRTRHRGRAHPLSRRRAGDDRSARRPGAAQDGHLRDGQPARRGRQAARARLSRAARARR